MAFSASELRNQRSGLRMSFSAGVSALAQVPVARITNMNTEIPCVIFSLFRSVIGQLNSENIIYVVKVLTCKMRRAFRATYFPPLMQYTLLAVRINKFPLAIAGVAQHSSSRSLTAISSYSFPALITTVRPFSSRKNTLLL